MIAKMPPDLDNATTADPYFILAPELSAGEWLNSTQLTLSQMRGRVVLIDFWDYSCLNCLRTLPYVVEWDKRYRRRGLAIIGVHAPEFAFAKNIEIVQRAAEANGLTYPVLLDNEFKTWKAFANQVWPAKYLIDADGFVRYRAFGEGRYDETEHAIQVLLDEANPDVDLPDLMPPLREEDSPNTVCFRPTEEIYAGAGRGQLGNREGYSQLPRDFRDPGAHQDGAFYLDGNWYSTPESSNTSQGGSFALKYHAAEINAVLAPLPPRQSVQITIQQGGAHLTRENAGGDVQISEQGVSFVVVDSPRMYNLVRNQQFDEYEIKLTAAFGGLSVYALTFTTCPVPPEVLEQLEQEALQEAQTRSQRR